jgi:protein-L-isoaspartate O-methyltransferase
MYENVGQRAKRVLVVGLPANESIASVTAMLAPDGKLIIMEPDAARSVELRARLSAEGMENRATVIGGDPARMLYKLAGPFDVIVCSGAHPSVSPLLQKLLATDGVMITNGEP